MHFPYIKNNTWHILLISASLSDCCLSCPSSVCLCPLLYLCDVSVWQPHMAMIETKPLVQMAHLSHTCLPEAVVAMGCKVKHLLLTSSLGGSFCLSGHCDCDPWPCYHLLLPLTPLLINVTLDSLTAPTPPLFHHTHACMITGREEYGKINTCNSRS